MFGIWLLLEIRYKLGYDGYNYLKVRSIDALNCFLFFYCVLVVLFLNFAFENRVVRDMKFIWYYFVCEIEFNIRV